MGADEQALSYPRNIGFIQFLRHLFQNFFLSEIQNQKVSYLLFKSQISSEELSAPKQKVITLFLALGSKCVDGDALIIQTA